MLKKLRYILLATALVIPAPMQAGILDIFSSEKKLENSTPAAPAKVVAEEPKVKALEPVVIKEKKDDTTAEGPHEKKRKYISEFPGPMPQGLDGDEVAPTIKENEDIDQLACKVTPTIGPTHQNMKPIKKSNNLMRKAGSPSKASGNYIQITGIIIDENCLPIPGAVIEIWQADTNGNYEWEYDQLHHFDLPLEGRDKNFLFSGMAQADNRGQFYLMTIFPGSKDDYAPHINVIVKRHGYETLHTRMYFSQHPRNDSDPILSGASDSARRSMVAKGQALDPSGKTEGRLYYFPVTMRGIGAYKRF